MDLPEYRAKIYEILSRRGYIEHAGELHFPESAVMDALEFIYHEIKNIPVENMEAKILEAANRAFAKLADAIQSEEDSGRPDPKQYGFDDESGF